MLVICRFFLYFIIYSFLGWLIEVGCKSIQYKRFVNRGFLLGPICPIYGYGVLFIVLLIGDDTSDILSIFLKSILICSDLEYFISYFMEKLFKVRWWDYSNNKFNINGRICLETMIPFGLLGTLVVYVIHPLIVRFVNLFSSNMIITIAIVLFIIYILDNILSFNVMNKIKKEIKKYSGDSTEIIKRKVTNWLEANSFLYRHLKKAYPKFRIIQRLKKK